MGATNLGQVAAFIQSVSVESIPEGQTPAVRNDGTKANAKLVFSLPMNSGAAAQQSAASALVSEGWAKGTQNGTAVPSTSPYHNKNAKYYKDQAETSATNAASSESNAEASETNAAASASSAETDALKAEGYAIGTQGGTAAESGEDYYHDNAKWYKEQAASSASSAADSADDAEVWADMVRNVAVGLTGNGFGVCNTNADTAAKEVSISEFTLFTGVKIQVLFSNGHTLTATKNASGVVTADYPTLNVSDTGAKAIKIGAEYAGENFAAAEDVHEFVYDGTYWRDVTAHKIYSYGTVTRGRDGVNRDSSLVILPSGNNNVQGSIFIA